MYYLLSFVNVTFWRSSLTKSIFVAVDESLSADDFHFQYPLVWGSSRFCGAFKIFIPLLWPLHKGIRRWAECPLSITTTSGLENMYPPKYVSNMYPLKKICIKYVPTLKLVGEKYSEGCSSFSN